MLTDEPLPTVSVTVRYWAGARAAAGVESEVLSAATVGELRGLAARTHPTLGAVLPRCSVLLDGQRCDDDRALPPDALVEVLPPFAGG